LARFNVMIDDATKPEWTSHFFVGMPAPAGAIVAMLPIYLHLSYFDMPNSPALVPYVIVYVLFVAMLMASRIPHFSGKKIGRVPRESYMPVLFGTAVSLLLLWQYPMEILIAIVLLYLGQVPLAMRRYASYVQADLEAKAATEGASEAG